MQWEYESENISPGESHYDVLHKRGAKGWEAWHIEKRESSTWREIFFKRPKSAPSRVGETSNVDRVLEKHPMSIEAGVCYREGPIASADYNEAIEDLLRAKRQAECRHICCSICEDSGHTAETCHHNPLILARRWAAATKVWCCYHCGFVATNDEEARDHFGKDDLEPAKCQRGEEDEPRHNPDAIYIDGR